MPQNTAAWIMGSRERITVKEASYTSPNPNEVVIETAAVAMNPLDIKLQDFDPIPTFPIAYPSIFGSDVAGTVVEIGTNVTSCKVGDRVMAHCFGFAIGRPEASAFQKYCITPEVVVVPIPDHVDFKDAAVLPLSCDSAMAGLFLDSHLGLQLPSVNATKKDETLIVWGGSSSVGCSVTQMARAAGYDVFAVASTRNHELCYSLGATRTFDYADAFVVERIIDAMKGRKAAGAYDCVGDHDATTRPCAQILDRCIGRKKVVSLLEPRSEGFPTNIQARRSKNDELVFRIPR
jgi:NADPH:quinone reductase-like Zn-dependent oxidoreductase